jgi:hypothetical protein
MKAKKKEKMTALDISQCTPLIKIEGIPVAMIPEIVPALYNIPVDPRYRNRLKPTPDQCMLYKQMSMSAPEMRLL